MNPIDYRDFAALARRHCGKCVLFARHAERPNLPLDDPGRPQGVVLHHRCTKKWLGFNYVSVKPASDAAEIWSVSIPKSATIKFFAPLSGIVAEKPEWLPRRKAGK